MNANTQIYDKAIDRAAMIRLYERRLNGKVSVILDGHVVRTEELIREAKLSPKGLLRLRETVDQELLKTHKAVYNVSKGGLLDLVADQASYAYQNIEVAMGNIWRTKRPGRIAENIVLEQPLHSNKTLEAGWGGILQGERVRLESVIRKGMADGKSIDEIALDVRRGNVHTITRQQSKALVVTAVTSVTAQTDAAVYRANKDAILGWQYVAVLDAATTPICRHRDGTIYDPEDKVHLPPAHYHCRSITVPVFKSWDDIAKLEGVAAVRKRNMSNLSKKQRAFYDGQTPLRESYHEWLLRQPYDVQIRHLGEYSKVELFRSGQLHLSKFTNAEGNSIGIKELRALTDSEYTMASDTRRFAIAKEKLDALPLGAVSPDDFLADPALVERLKEYYLLQSKELDGTLSLTNYRGQLIHTKRNTKSKVINQPPTEAQLVFNPITGRYDDTRFYQPNPAVFNNNLRLVRESPDLLAKDKTFIEDFVNGLEGYMGINERAVISDNLRIIFTRYRKNPEPWGSFKAVAQSQIKFDVMNVSDAIETHIRADIDFLKKLSKENFLDPVLGPTQLQELHDNFLSNIQKKNAWEDRVAPKIARELRDIFDRNIPIKISRRLTDRDLQHFYLKFAHRLALADSPDFDQFAVQLGRDLHNLANYTGTRNAWYALGKKLLESNNKLFKVETFGVQKRRMKSRMGGHYFGPYYDTLSYNIRLLDPRIVEYAQLTRKVETGFRVSVTDPKNRLFFKEGRKTYFMKGVIGDIDTRIPITSTSSFSEFPSEFIDKQMVAALNWASKAEYKVDNDFHDFIKKLLYFTDDKGKSKYYDSLNEYKHYMLARGDAYERFKTMEWLRASGKSFTNHPFIDHRARIYERGFVGPQAGESFRPFLNTAQEKILGVEGYQNFKDQIGAFLGGLSDKLEGRYSSLTFTGRQKIAEMHWEEMVKIGNHMIRGKPDDIRKILESTLLGEVEGEDLGKFYRLAIETAKIDNYMRSYTFPEGASYVVSASKTAAPTKALYVNSVDEALKRFGKSAEGRTLYVYKEGMEERVGTINVGRQLRWSVAPDELRMNTYKTALALEQDASSSGAQIIALTTKNKKLAELSNVVPTTQKRRLYDEIAAATFNDPRFRELNLRLGLTEKDLRKAAKAQNMVTFYGAGVRTGILNVEGKLAKALGKETNTLVVKAAERDAVLNEISARMARFQKFDPETYADLKTLRENVKAIFDKGLDPGDEIMSQLYFLDSKTRDLVLKLTQQYDKVVTPNDFKQIAAIMSEHLSEQVPILKLFTKFYGRLAEDFLSNADPKKAAFDWTAILKQQIIGGKKKHYKIGDKASEILGIKADESIAEKLFKRFTDWDPNGTLYQIIFGVEDAKTRRTGASFFGTSIRYPTLDLKGGKKTLIKEIEVLHANKLPKAWTNVPSVNFDGKVIEQNFTQTFEEKLLHKDKDGNWITNILQVPQKTGTTWWEETVNASGKINDIADATKARTAFGVNANHSNDAVLVKKFHLWGKDNNIQTATVHDAFFANAADMLKARRALRKIYADAINNNAIKQTLDEMRARGLPKPLYDEYLNEAIDTGLIPVPGRSRIDGKLLKDTDILKREDILREIPDGFFDDFGFYGVG
jgi:SPP1 gp7 family putative phage head morphogenesis protein